MLRNLLAGAFIISFSVLFVFYVRSIITINDPSRFHLEEIADVNSSDYIIDTPKCKMLDVDPFDPQVKQFYSQSDYMSCTDKELLTYVTKLGNVTTLRVNPRAVSSYSTENILCCYSKIKRRQETSFALSSCRPFSRDATLVDNEIKVECSVPGARSPVYVNTHAQIIVKKDVTERLTQTKEAAFSVLLLGIDSVSRLGFIRNLPNSYKLLRDNSWIVFKGYNKVADNTYPNLMAVLTGYDKDDSVNKCQPRTIDGLNSCPMVWYDYRTLGYVTAYAEDQTDLSTFNLDKEGFKVPPTDYYFRPYFLASESLEIKKHYGMKYCTGPETSGERVLNIAKDFATTFVTDPNFGLFWMNTFSHNNLNTLSMMDGKITEFLQDITNRGVLENSVVIFLSDHGARFGTFRQTTMGWLEERLPFFFLWIPHRFRQKFPQEYDNIRNNAQHKLTNNYDLYMTLQHLLVLSGRNYTMKPSPACPNCKSLFSEIDDDRSCEDVAIDQHWCTCTDFSPINKDKTITKAALFVIEQLHNTIHLKKGDRRCRRYSLKKIIVASRSRNSPQVYTLVVFETRPKAVFEATLLNNPNSTQMFKLKGGISRLDIYEPNSKCVKGDLLKKFCYCK